MIKNVFVVDMLMAIQIWWVWQDRTHKLHPGEIKITFFDYIITGIVGLIMVI